MPAQGNTKAVALMGGSYEARSLIANAQRCLNLYPEKNPGDSPFPYTHYPTPGKTVLAEALGKVSRCLYRASTGALFQVAGNTVYSVAVTSPGVWARTVLATIPTTNGIAYIQDNGISCVLVVGGSDGYQWTLADPAGTFAAIVDAAWYGATRVDTIDTFLVFNRPGTNQWYSTLSNTVTPLDALYIASKASYPDPIQTIAVMHREIWLIGTQTTEVWYDAGNSGFPFAIIPGVFIEHGCVAPASLAKHDLTLFWLSLDKDGQAVVVIGEKYAASRISTSAIEYEFSTYGDVSNAVGMVYLQQGHVFYQLSFPTVDKTWVFDRTQGLWHERCWVDGEGVEHQDRINQMAFAYGTNVGADWETGALYAIDPDAYTDAGSPIKRVRSWPHMVGEGARVKFYQFVADMQVGSPGGDTETLIPDSALRVTHCWTCMVQDGTQLCFTTTQAMSRVTQSGLSRVTQLDTAFGYTMTDGPLVTLRWSDTRGASWGDPVSQSFGATGQFYTQVQWQRLGLARDRVFELSWSAPIRTALNGAYVDAEALPY